MRFPIDDKPVGDMVRYSLAAEKHRVVLLTSTIYTVMLIDDACFHVVVYVISACVLVQLLQTV